MNKMKKVDKLNYECEDLIRWRYLLCFFKYIDYCNGALDYLEKSIRKISKSNFCMFYNDHSIPGMEPSSISKYIEIRENRLNRLFAQISRECPNYFVIFGSTRIRMYIESFGNGGSIELYIYTTEKKLKKLIPIKKLIRTYDADIYEDFGSSIEMRRKRRFQIRDYLEEMREKIDWRLYDFD